MLPPLALGQVLSHDTSRRAVYVVLQSGQIPTVPVLMGFDGPADALRVRTESMPTKGTWGLIAFPNGDSRNGVWLKSIYTQLSDALPTDTDPFSYYNAEWSGFWQYRDQQGNDSMVYPDGTSLTVSQTGDVPTLIRHIVNAQQVREAQEFTQQERVPSPPKPFIVNLQHASGTQVKIDSAGNTTINGASGATLTINFGGTVVTINGEGNVDIQGANTGVLSFPSGLTIDANTQINGDLVVSDNISDLNGANGTVNAIRTVYNSHDHVSEAAGTNTSTPNQQMP